MYVSIGGLTLPYLYVALAIVSGLLLIGAGSLVLLRSNRPITRYSENKTQEQRAETKTLAHGSASERRTVSDRRGWEPMPKPPFKDSTGVVVIKDRRRMPDRRIRSIQVEELG